MTQQRVELSRYTNNSIGIQRKVQGYIPDGSDNLHANYLNGLLNSAPTHSCIVLDLTDYTKGLGLVAQNESEQKILDQFFNKKFQKKSIKSKYSQACVCIEVVRNDLHAITDIISLDPSQIKVKSIDRGVPSLFAFKSTWNRKEYSSSIKEVVIPAFDQTSPRSLIYWYDSGTFDVPYGRPEYLAAVDSIELEASLYMGDNHGTQNGSHPSMVITQETSGDADKDKEASRIIDRNLAGVANRGKTSYVFTKVGSTTPPTVTLLNDTSKESKKVNYEVAEAGILKGWRIPSPTLISGLNTKPIGLAASPEDEVKNAKKDLFSKIIDPEREEYLEIISPLFEDLGINSEVTFKDSEEEVVIDSEGVETIITEGADVAAVDKEASYNGSQISSALGIMDAVSEGTLTAKQAEVFLIQMLQFTPTLAASVFEGIESSPIVNGENNSDLSAPINESIKNLTGRQMQGIERIVRKHNKGTISTSQAALMIKTGFGFSEAEALIWLEPAKTEMSNIKKVFFSKLFEEKNELDALIDLGETEEDFKGWKITSVVNVDYDIEDQLDNHIAELNKDYIHFASTGVARPSTKSAQDGVEGTTQYKVRYRYVGEGEGERDFCNKMIGAKKLYRKEDIINMSFSNVNVGFGKGGSNNYNIFFYKGGPNCKHYWERVTFIREGKGGIDVRSPKAKKLTETQADNQGLDPNNDKKVGTKPFDMPNRGYFLSKLIEKVNKWL